MEVPSPASGDQEISWLIIGGGVHGTALSIALRNSGVGMDEMRVIDPHPTPFAEFERLCLQTGMEFMRSPVEHHLDTDPNSLRVFADGVSSDQPIWSDHGNPSSDLWLKHSAFIVAKSGVNTVRRQGEVTRVTPYRQGYRVETTTGVCSARNVVVAPGGSYGPNWPWWARQLLEADDPPRICHAFERGAPSMLALAARRPLVVGGGITAAQLAIAYAKRWREGSEPVTLLSYHPLRVAAFDCDTEWMSVSKLYDFASEQDFEERRRIVDRAKVRGTITPEVDSTLQRAIAAGALRVVIARVTGASLLAEGMVEIKLEDSSVLRSDAITLATGFAHQHRTSSLLEMFHSEMGLPRNGHGDPIISENLTWERDGLFVAGALAELQLGPFASNIIGARWACERVRNAAL